MTLALLVMMNNLAHDFSAAGWIFGSLYAWLILRKAKQAEDARPYVGVLVFNQWVMRLSLVGVILFGIVRYVLYSRYEWSEPAGQSQVTMLIAKHVFFFVIVALGILIYLSVHKFRREIRERAQSGE